MPLLYKGLRSSQCQQCSNKLAMKLTTALVLISLLATAAHSLEERAFAGTTVTKKIKTANVDIKVLGNRAELVLRKNDGTRFEHRFITNHPKLTNKEELTVKDSCEKLTTCIGVKDVTYVKIRIDPASEVIEISREIDGKEARLTDCFTLAENTQWFGGPQLRHQRWPLQQMYYEEEAYVPTHPENMALAERYWLSSKGVYVMVDERDPLFLDQNNLLDRHLCLVAKNGPPYRPRARVQLRYEIGVFADPRQAHEHVVSKHFGHPSGHPNERMVTHPIWSTWARYKADINESIVRRFADEIVQHGFDNSQLEIDDNWETCYGSANFDPAKFPDVRKLTSDLKAKKFRVTLWIHPFINEGCNDAEAYDYALTKGFFVKNDRGEVHTTWWQGSKGAGAIDFSNPKAVEWWVGRLKKLEKLGIDSFKFDAGEESFLPQPPTLQGPEELQPGLYTFNYTSNLAKHFDDSIEARVGWRSQRLPIFVRMIDKDTRWSFSNGLPTLVTTLLQMNLNGYVFVLPDMIGGNGYANGSLTATELPSKEMFVRWLQANVFMPSLQYSFVPWDFDDETIELSKTFTQMHAKVAPKIVELMKKSVQTGAPLNPPIWWVDPKNVEAHKINDEYLLGEEILVAPVLEENALERNVYLPAGKWRDGTTNITYNGPAWLRNYPAPLNVLPHFYKV